MQIICLVCVLFVFGLIYQAFTVFENENRDERTFSVYFENTAATKDDEKFATCIDGRTYVDGTKQLLEYIDNEYEEFISYGIIKQDGKEIRFCVGGGTYNEGGIANPGTVVVDRKVLGENYSVGDTIIIGGREYTVSRLATTGGVAVFFSDISDVPSGSIMRDIIITLEHQPTYTKAQEIISFMNKVYMMPQAINAPESLELLDQQLNKTQIVVSMVMILFVVFNCSLCYNYIYSSNKDTLRVMRICGATRNCCNLLYLSEVLLHTLISFMLAYLLFEYVVKNIAIKYYNGIEPAYTFENYVFIFWSYLIICVIIMTICMSPFSSQSIIQEK